MKAILPILFVVLLLPMPGWAQSAQAQEPALAKLVIYRRTSFFGGYCELWVNNEAVAQGFRSNTYFELEVPPGNLRLLTTGRPTWAISSKRFRLQVEAGKTYYIEVVLDYDFIASTFYLEDRTKEEFLKRRNNMKLDEQAKRKLD